MKSCWTFRISTLLHFGQFRTFSLFQISPDENSGGYLRPKIFKIGVHSTKYGHSVSEQRLWALTTWHGSSILLAARVAAGKCRHLTAEVVLSDNGNSLDHLYEEHRSETNVPPAGDLVHNSRLSDPYRCDITVFRSPRLGFIILVCNKRTGASDEIPTSI